MILKSKAAYGDDADALSSRLLFRFIRFQMRADSMSKLNWWKTIFCLCVFCVVAAIGSPAQTLTTLHSFNGTDGNGDTDMVLVRATDGNLYGTTQAGGANNAGTVFKIISDGTLTTLYNFCSQLNCASSVRENHIAGLGVSCVWVPG
jgi:uncharacterized repeat protein (TIGR03803 family)